MFNFNRNQLIAAALLVVVAFLGTAILVARSSGEKPQSVKLIPADAAPVTTELAPTPETKILVHVAGKVKAPGVYKLAPGTRVQDAIKAAGGPAANADMETINLVEPLTDGEQVFIAAKGTVPVPTKSLVRTAVRVKTPTVKAESAVEVESAPQKLTTPGDGTVNINTASLDDLQRLPGIGPAMAQRIIDYRTENTGFKSVDELDEVSGIGPKKIERLRPFISI